MNFVEAFAFLFLFYFAQRQKTLSKRLALHRESKKSLQSREASLISKTCSHSGSGSLCLLVSDKESVQEARVVHT